MAEEIKKQWYVVNTYAGHENRVKENLQRDNAAAKAAEATEAAVEE